MNPEDASWVVCIERGTKYEPHFCVVLTHLFQQCLPEGIALISERDVLGFSSVVEMQHYDALCNIMQHCLVL